MKREKEKIIFDDKGKQVTGPLVKSHLESINAVDIWNGWIVNYNESNGSIIKTYYNVITGEKLEHPPGWKPMEHWDDNMTDQQNYLLDRLKETMDKLESISGSQGTDLIKEAYNEMIGVWEEFTKAPSINHSSEISKFEKELFDLQVKDTFLMEMYGPDEVTKGIVGEEREKNEKSTK